MQKKKSLVKSTLVAAALASPFVVIGAGFDQVAMTVNPGVNGQIKQDFATARQTAVQWVEAQIPANAGGYVSSAARKFGFGE